MTGRFQFHQYHIFPQFYNVAPRNAYGCFGSENRRKTERPGHNQRLNFPIAVYDQINYTAQRLSIQYINNFLSSKITKFHFRTPLCIISGFPKNRRILFGWLSLKSQGFLLKRISSLYVRGKKKIAGYPAIFYTYATFIFYYICVSASSS